LREKLKKYFSTVSHSYSHQNPSWTPK